MQGYRNGLDDLRRLTDMGALFLSATTIEVLDQLQRDLENFTPYNAMSWGHLAHEEAAITMALQKIREIAKADLKS